MKRTSLFSATVLSVLGTLAAVVAAPRDAHASGYLTARFGADHGTPAAPNVYAVYFNPAAMGGTKGTTITGDLSLAVRWARYVRSNDALSPSGDATRGQPGYAESNVGRAELLNLLALPYAGVTTDFGTKSLRGGLAVYVPFGGFATWNRDNNTVTGIPGSTDGTQRWHNISGQILALNQTAALSLNLHESFAIGANVSGIYHHVGTVRARTPDDSDDTTGPDGSLKEGRSYLNASGYNLSAAFGVYFQRDRTKIGLSYTSQPGFGETRLGGELTQQLGNTAAAVVPKKIDFVQTYPDIVRLGASYLLPGDKVELRADGEFVRWSVFDSQCVVEPGKECKTNADGSSAVGPSDIVLNLPRNWNNAVGFRAGAAYFVDPSFELFGSTAFTTSAVPKRTIDASTIDSFRLYFTVGARKNLGNHWALAGSYTHIAFVPVDTAGENRNNQLLSPSKSPSSDGRYYSQIGFFNVNASYTF